MDLQQRKRWRIWTWWSVCVLLVLSLFVAGCGGAAPTAQSATTLATSDTLTPSDAPLGIWTLDINHGDAILIKAGGEYSLIDAGDVKPESRDKLMRELSRLGVKKLKYVIISHPHADHYGGVVTVAKKYPIVHVYDNGEDHSARSFSTYKSILTQKHIPRDTLSEGDVLDLGGGVKFQVLADANSVAQPKDGKINVNNQSIVGRLTYGKFSMLFTGDAERDEEAYLNKKYNTKLSSTVLKVGHHGSDTSSTEDFLGAVRPSYAVISAALCDEYNHPRPDPMKRIADAIQRFHKDLQGKNTIYRTDEDGTIQILTDGEHISITTVQPHPDTLNLRKKNYQNCNNH